MMVAKRRKLHYLKRKEESRYDALIEKLGTSRK